MKKFTESELIALTGVLKMECLGLAFGRVTKPLIEDEDLKKLAEASLLETEGKLKAVKKFVSTNIMNDEVSI